MKLIKAYLSFKQPGLSLQTNTYLLKAIKKILANELNCTFNENNFPASNQYYQTLLSVVQSELEQVEYGLLNAVELLVLKQSILLHLKSDASQDCRLLLQSLFIKYNRCIAEMEAHARSRQSGAASDELFRYLLDEHKAFVYYLVGLLLLRQDSPKVEEKEHCLLKRVFNGLDNDDLSYVGQLLSNEETKMLLDNHQMLASICFIISLNKSKPSSELTARIEHQLAETKQQSDLASVSNLLAKCINRDSAWRYSVISHWLKFKLKSNKDKLCFFNTLCELTTNPRLVSLINLTNMLGKSMDTFNQGGL